ncbi:hypothetical protein NL108_008833, partial [Boleophthalmus pectinirostris]
FLAWFISYMLLVPVFLSVLILGFRKWKNQSSSVSHSDVFTLHMVGMEMLTVLGSVLFTVFARVAFAFDIGMALYHMSANGQLYFHSLTCVERYLAVVHPITYLRLKKRGGVIIRSVSIVLVWVLSVFNSLAILHSFRLENMIQVCLVISSLVLMSFCSVSVLCVLIRPGPGEGGGAKKQLIQSKKSAFYTITVILAVLVGRLVNSLVFQSMSLFTFIPPCVMITSMLWFSFPSSLV